MWKILYQLTRNVMRQIMQTCEIRISLFDSEWPRYIHIAQCVDPSVKWYSRLSLVQCHQEPQLLDMGTVRDRRVNLRLI